MSINPADWWDEKPKAKAHGGRVVKHLHDDEEEQPDPNTVPHPPLLAGDAMGNLRFTGLRKREPAMPKGQYERKPRKPANDAPEGAVAAPKNGRPRKGSGNGAAKPVVRPGALPRIVIEGDTATFTGLTREQIAALVAAL